MDVVQIIEAEHRQVERLFARFERAARARDLRTQAEVAREIVRELSIHASVEEQVLYPALQRAGMAPERLDALEDHHAVKLALSELQALSPENERFAAKLHLVEKSTRMHVEEEEATLLPRLGQAVAQEELERLGAEFETLRGSAPTRPHPASPDMPPVNILTNAIASIVDRAQDAVANARMLVRSSARDLLASAVRAGREAAGRTRQSGEALAGEARAAGERALDRARLVGAEVIESAAERGEEVAGRLEHRTAVAAREVAGGAHAAAQRARRTTRRATGKTGRAAKRPRHA